MNVNEILKDIGQKQPEKKKKTAPRIQMYTTQSYVQIHQIFMKLMELRN